jgi:hypothetical protein
VILLNSVLGEYGKTIVLAILLCSVLLVFFADGESSFLNMLKVTEPVETVGHVDTYELVHSIFTRKPPVLSVKVRKLKKEQEYNLLDRDEFVIEGKNQEGNDADVLITKILNPEKQNITKEVNPEKFIPFMSGEYIIKYQARESFQGSIKTTEKEYKFLAD